MLFFSEKNFRGNHAGTKARNDAEMILRQFGAKPINAHALELRNDVYENIYSNIKNRLGYIRFYIDTLFVRNQTIIVQYPMLAFDIQFDYIQKLSKYNRVIFLVHDIQSLRRDSHHGLQDEIRMLNLATGLIVHNRFMEDKLKQIGVCVNTYYRLECFDYLFDNKTNNPVEDNVIVFAGNLDKSEFIPMMCTENPTLQFSFYGPGWRFDSRNATHHGSFLPDEIPGKVEGRFGLVWDGKTVFGCTGALGEYTRINNPHKLSLYIAAGLPIIAWNDAAIAEFIQKYNIGITVKELTYIQDAVNGITEEQYKTMRENVLRIQKSVTTGVFLQRVLNEIERNNNA